ncbi:MAG: chaperonin GroEL [Ktedonobacteraceae bacterium]|nr:chaperonin GroEL [Ktedonobacteraceae bacterium]
MAKQLQFNARAQYSIRKGIEILAGAVRGTLGPKGRNVILDHPLDVPQVLNDGVTIARGIDLEEPFTNMVVQLLKEAAIKTNEMVGDGTTTATILAQAIVAEGLKNIAAGANPMLLRNGLELAAAAALEELKAISKPVETHEEIVRIATMAAGDVGIGALIAGVFEHVGRDGIVLVEEGDELTTQIEYIKGMQLDRGYISPYMVNDQARMEAVLTSPAILVTDKKITTITELVPLLERLLAAGQKELLVVAEDITGEALTTLIVNKTQGILHALGIRAPGFGDRREAMMEDIALLTGGQLISEKTGRRLESATLADLGSARSVTTTKNSTVIVDGNGDKEVIQARIRELRAQLAHAANDYDREKLQQRLANLAGGVGVIKVGGATGIEIKERKLRVQDALAAVRVALEEGVVPGGGVALVMVQPALESVRTELPEEVAGVNALKRALEAPLRQIARNAGFESSVVVAKVRDQPFGFGFDALTGHYVDMFKAGIIDPARVTSTALQIAVSIAGLFLTTDTLVTDAPVHIPSFKEIEFGL